MGNSEFVAFIGAVMAVNALGIDIILPALGMIGRDLSIDVANDQQWIVSVYMIGFAIGQLVYGPLADRFGRKPILVGTLAGYVIASILAGSSITFEALLRARLLQGLMSASTRVLAMAIIRDVASGWRMARTMSLAQMVFFLVPVLAPTLGQGLLAVGSWRFVLQALGAFVALVLIWALMRLPETLAKTRRIPISPTSLHQNYRAVLTNRRSVGYALASSLTFGGIVGYVTAAQQIFVTGFGAGHAFSLLFAICGGAMGVASFANSRLVKRFGARLISQWAIVALISLSIIHMVLIFAGAITLVSYVILQSLSMACIGLCGANFASIAMEPMGHIAGTASSLQGFITTIGAVLIGSLIGHSYAGTTLPVAIGYLCIGILALAIIYYVEEGQLFRTAPSIGRGGTMGVIGRRLDKFIELLLIDYHSERSSPGCWRPTKTGMGVPF